MAVRASVAIPAASSKSIGLSWPLVAIVVATVARFALIAVPSHGYDSFAYKHWTWRLVHEPLHQFYIDDGQAFPDHLPGDLWLFKLLGSAARFVDSGINFYGPVYGALISLLAISFDALLVISLIWIGRTVGQESAGKLAGIAYWCAPAPIFVASVWGQIDGISIALAIVALGLAVGGRFSLAFIALTLCVLVKPPFAMLTLPLLVGWWHTYRASVGVWLRRVAVTGFGCVAILAIMSAPFGVSLVGEWGRWSLVERIQLASDTYTVSTLGAHNLWILFDPFNWPPDDRHPWVLGLSRYSVGLALFAVVVAYTGWVLLARWRGAITMVFTSNVLMIGFFLFMTRMHERYLFPVIALSILLALMDSRFRNYAFAVNALVLANIALRFLWPKNNDWTGWRYLAGFGWLEHAWFVQLLAIVTMVVFAWLSIEGSRRVNP